MHVYLNYSRMLTNWYETTSYLMSCPKNSGYSFEPANFNFQAIFFSLVFWVVYSCGLQKMGAVCSSETRYVPASQNGVAVQLRISIIAWAVCLGNCVLGIFILFCEGTCEFDSWASYVRNLCAALGEKAHMFHCISWPDYSMEVPFNLQRWKP